MPRSREDRILPVAPVDKLIRIAGADPRIRVADKGAERLAKILEEIGMFLAKRAYEITIHSGRKTITDKDIDLVFKQWGQPI